MSPLPEKPRKATRMETLDAFLKTAAMKTALKSPAELTEPVECPAEFFAAFVTGRPELIKLVKPRSLNETECAAIYKLVAVLIETNSALREHAETVGKAVGDWADLFKGLNKLGWEIENFAQFKPSATGDDERIAA